MLTTFLGSPMRGKPRTLDATIFKRETIRG